MTLVNAIAIGVASAALALAAGEWSAPADVLHEMKPCVTYKARLDGDVLVIRAEIQPGWHTFAIDNEKRAAEKLAGKKSLGIDQPTQIKLNSGLQLAGDWHQLEPKDFSKPKLRWFSWGFENEAVFAAKVHKTGAGPAQIGIRGQACSDNTCRNIDVALSVPVPAKTEATTTDLAKLVAVKP
jgi:hypothetical protein